MAQARDAVGQMGSAVDGVAAAMDGLQSIRGSIETTGGRILGIFSSIEEQSQAAPEIPKLVSHTETISAATKQDLAAACQELSNLAEASERLDLSLQKFRRS